MKASAQCIYIYTNTALGTEAVSFLYTKAALNRMGLIMGLLASICHKANKARISEQEE